MTRNELALRNKLLVGLSLSYTRLIEKKQIEDGDLIFTKNGKIVKVRARKLSNGIQTASAGII